MRAPVAGALLALIVAQPAPAQQRSWPEEKCARYAEAWTEAQARFGRQGLSREFFDAQGAFIASGCRSRASICPASPQELDIANAVTIAAMNAGMASSFVPFRCPG